MCTYSVFVMDACYLYITNRVPGKKCYHIAIKFLNHIYYACEWIFWCLIYNTRLTKLWQTTFSLKTNNIFTSSAEWKQLMPIFHEELATLPRKHNNYVSLSSLSDMNFVLQS